MDERMALDLCCQGPNPEAFEYLVEQFRREAFFHALGFMGNEHDAADACQEAFTRAYAALPKLTQIQHFYPWYYRILKNLCLNTLKRQKRADGHSREPQVAPKNQSWNPVVLAEQDERKAQVWEVLGEMPPKFREILVLKHFRGLSYTEISERLSIPRGTVMSRLFHARKTFQGLFQGKTKDTTAKTGQRRAESGV